MQDGREYGLCTAAMLALAAFHANAAGQREAYCHHTANNATTTRATMSLLPTMPDYGHYCFDIVKSLSDADQ